MEHGACFRACPNRQCSESMARKSNEHYFSALLPCNCHRHTDRVFHSKATNTLEYFAPFPNWSLLNPYTPPDDLHTLAWD